MKKILLFACILLCTMANAQERFTYSDIADGKFSQKSVSGLRSMADGEHYTVMEDGKIVRYKYSSGEEVDVVCDIDTLNLGAKVNNYQFSADEQRILLQMNSRPLYRRSSFSEYVVYDCQTKKATPLIDNKDVRYAEFSPAGDKVAFVLYNNIYIKDLSANSECQITFDGKVNEIINGLPDWVYEEEWGISHALCWSPDGEKIAYLRSDERHVKELSMMKYLTNEVYPEVFTYKYPFAGEENSIVSLHVFNLADDSTITVDTGEEKNQYVPYFDWTPDGQLYFYRINRMQNHLEVILAECGRMIYEEKSDKYIDQINLGTLTFLSDSRGFVVRNETTAGYFHLYLYDINDGLVAPITEGEWNVTGVVSLTDKKVWYLSTEISPLTREFYSINLDGKNKKRLSTEIGTYRILPSKKCKYYISYFSNVTTPNTVTLHKGNGKLIRVLEDNAELKNYIKEIGLPVKEFLTFTTPEGYVLNGYMIKPNDFDPTKKYPILLTQYSGPGSQDVRDRWSIDWEDALVQKGYIVVDFDPRGTGYRSEEFKKLTYGIMGRLETEDQIAAAKWVATLPYVDSNRIGVYGWSYGGFMALNCILKGADVFKMAIAVAPVTSWRFYDSIYTERVNGLPQTNAEGYDEPSPLGYAKNLEGKLLIMHGSADDNVHLLNTMKIVDEFADEGKLIDMMIYTDNNHSMMPKGRHSIRQKMVDYCVENL